VFVVVLVVVVVKTCSNHFCSSISKRSHKSLFNLLLFHAFFPHGQFWAYFTPQSHVIDAAILHRYASLLEVQVPLAIATANRQTLHKQFHKTNFQKNNNSNNNKCITSTEYTNVNETVLVKALLLEKLVLLLV
jgi:hypothetical protein